MAGQKNDGARFSKQNLNCENLPWSVTTFPSFFPFLFFFSLSPSFHAFFHASLLIFFCLVFLLRPIISLLLVKFCTDFMGSHLQLCDFESTLNVTDFFFIPCEKIKKKKKYIYKWSHDKRWKASGSLWHDRSRKGKNFRW